MSFTDTFSQNNTDALMKQIEEYRFALSKFSHEVRNPVTLINSSLQLLEKEHPDLASSDLWQDTMKDMAFLRKLLDELSCYNNTFRCTKEPVSMSPYLTRIASDAEKICGTASILFHCEIEGALPVLEIDKIKLNEALTNLLRNAFEAAKKTVSFCAFTKDSCLVITIYNDGDWIAPDKQAILFKPFETTKASGTGLGLPIADGILKAHDAKLLLSSDEKLGTTFTIHFPGR